ncbi:hypothetical protein [Kitasatospora sp. NPDC087315]|uniref:hypothetical protein n=1 Tax=Kitasatospora sp. NPDC087315 TaxID=3364069 RepID=UPI0037F8B16F
MTTDRPALVPATRRGLFTADADDRLRPGTPDRPWELWLTDPNVLVPKPDLATALMAAAEHNAIAADCAALQPVNHAVVLHHGYVWTRTAAARSTAGIAVPSLCWTAKCSVCGDLVEDEYIPHHASPEDAANDAVGREWHELPDGRLVCDSADDAHDDARAQALPQDDTPEQPDENQLPLL